jgi:CspA family cold shock protein
MSTERQTGTVKWFNDQKGFGFIAHEGGNDVFVHQNEIQSDGYRSLLEGDSVEFSIEQGPKGPSATKVTKVS